MKLRWIGIQSKIAVLAVVTCLLALTGCMYPKENTPGGMASAREAVLIVQDAIDRYYADKEVLPIHNADQTVPVYEKYRIHFGRLKSSGYLANVPPAAFESGGSNQFIIIDEETKPTVKLLDLVVFQAVADMQKKVDQYRMNNAQNVPAGEDRYEDFTVIDYKRLGTKEPTVLSMFSRNPLELLLDKNGQVYADYAFDLMTAVQKSGATPQPDTDMRHYLIDQSYYVPVKSPVYYWKDGAPIPVQPPAVNE